MSGMKIYNSQGERLGEDQSAVSTRIEDFFFNGVRLHLETSPQIELTVFFRARESKASRADQYYAVYQADSLRQIFDQFSSEHRDIVEKTHGMILETTSEDVQVSANINAEHQSPASTAENDDISSLLSERRRVEFGVPTAEDALGLLQQHLAGSARSVVITEDASGEEIEDCDLIIEIGSYDGLTPLGKTEQLLAEKERQRIGASRPRSQISGTEDESKADKIKRIGKTAAIFILTFIIALVVIIAIINIAAALGFGLGAFDPIVFV